MLTTRSNHKHKAIPQNGHLAPEVLLERGLYTLGEPPTPIAQRHRLVAKGKGQTAIKGHGPKSRAGAHSDQTWRLGAAVRYHPARRLERLEAAPPPGAHHDMNRLSFRLKSFSEKPLPAPKPRTILPPLNFYIACGTRVAVTAFPAVEEATATMGNKYVMTWRRPLAPRAAAAAAPMGEET